MEAQLKALRVPELKAILQKAGLPSSGKKDDLIARIIASAAATASLKPDAETSAEPSNVPAGPDDELLAPPEEFDWGTSASNGDAIAVAAPRAAAAAAASTSAIPSVVAAAVPPGSSAVTATPASSVSGNNAELKPTPVTSNVLPQVISAAESTAKVAGEDDEMAKRQARAARFGIPVVEPKKPPTSKGTEMQPQINTADSELATKKAARAARFGLQNASAKPHPSNAKPSVDAAEEEKKRKRAERFGLKVEAPDTKKSKTS